METKSLMLLNVGVIGLTISVLLSLTSSIFIQQLALELFGLAWWSNWAPTYLIWLVFIVISICCNLKVGRS